jgi:hypothetical protein
MSIDQRSSAQKAADAQIDKQVAEDVAVGMAAQADRQERRADINAVAADINAVEAERQAMRANTYAVQADQTRRERDRAVYEGAVAREQARSSQFMTWLLSGILGTGLLLGLIWYLSRTPDQQTASTTSTTTVIRQVPAAQPTPATVVAPVILPNDRPMAAAPTPAPVVRERIVPVPVPVPARPASGSATSAVMPSSDATTSGNTGATQSGGALPGYVEPSATSDTVPTTNTGNSGSTDAGTTSDTTSTSGGGQ